MDILSYSQKHYTARQMRSAHIWASLRVMGIVFFLIPVLSNILCPQSPFTELMYTPWYLPIVYALTFIILPILQNCFCSRDAYIPLSLVGHTAITYGADAEICIRKFRNKRGRSLYLLRYKKCGLRGSFVGGFVFPLIYHRQGKMRTYDYVMGIDNVCIGMMPVVVFFCVLASLRTDPLSALCIVAFFLPVEVVAITKFISYNRRIWELARRIPIQC